MSDQSERIKNIVAGNLDAQLPDYEEFTAWLQRMPLTWMPGFLAETVETCVKREVFRTDGLLAFVAAAESRARR